ncbi:MAG: signal peptide peptidase SppA [Desulfobacteraceae bacterium]|nr:MAG: signal peptide peptidase SppA [Desulfobacteraceae bacterium]
MFSRRHPYLFFMITMSITTFSFVVLISLIFKSGSKSSTFVSGEKVGIVEITGVIIDSKSIIENIKTFREDDSVKAIVLRIDSPGGGVGPSQEIFHEVRKTAKQKKVITSMGAVAASGGYYIAAGSNGIMANPGTITGSIGVIMGYTNFQEIFQKIGLIPVVIKSGEFKDMGSPVREMTTTEKKLLQGFVDQIHHQFVKDASKGRSMDLQEMMSLADGRIFTGEEAKGLGLVDRLGNLEDAIEWAGRLGGIKGKISRIYPEEKGIDLLKEMMGSSVRQIFENTFRSHITSGYLFQPGNG